MKKIIITSVVALLIPEIANCMQSLGHKRITVNGYHYQEDGNGNVIAMLAPKQHSHDPRGLVSINGLACKVSRIGSSRKSNLTSICIPSSVEIISKYCFKECENLRNVAFESNPRLRTIRKFAFFSCGSIASVCVPASVENIGEECFNGCSCLSKVTFEPDLQLSTIGRAVFACCHSLASICVPSSVRRIGESCFTGCYSLSIVTFESESQLTIMGDSAFCDCASLESICIPASVETIGRSCFGFTILTAGLSSIAFESSPQSVTVGEGAFPAEATVNANDRPLVDNTNPTLAGIDL